jgi:acetyltransferase-like isoleucine patch superfamily enzyme
LAGFTYVLCEQQAQDKNVLQNKLDLSNQNAEILANFINKAPLVTINTNKTAAVAHLENVVILNEKARLYNTKIKIFGNGNKLIIGENCKIKTKKRINFSKDIIIGDHVWIAAMLNLKRICYQKRFYCWSRFDYNWRGRE